MSSHCMVLGHCPAVFDPIWCGVHLPEPAAIFTSVCGKEIRTY
jgi:hypothetical protein